jgi:hypothetical protein
VALGGVLATLAAASSGTLTAREEGAGKGRRGRMIKIQIRKTNVELSEVLRMHVERRLGFALAGSPIESEG